MLLKSTLKICSSIATLVFSTAYAANNSLTVATFNIPPWGMLDGGKPSGITFDMANAIAKEAGLTIVNSVIPFPRFWRAIQLGESDVGIMHRTPESESVAEPLAPTLVNPEIILLPKKGLILKRLEDLANLSLGVTRGGLELQDDRIAKNKSIRISEFAAEPQGIKMLLSGRIDCMISSKEATLYAIKMAKMSPTEFGTPLTLSTKEGWVMFSRNSPNQHLKAKVQAATRKLQKQGVFLQIRKKYLGY